MKALVLGHTGFLGSKVFERLSFSGHEVFGASRSSGSDFRQSGELRKVINKTKAEVVINCAAVVGGIEYGRTHPIKIYRDNLFMTLNILEEVSEANVRLINIISNCAYPSKATLFKESEFWDGPLDQSVLVYGGIRKLGWVGSWAYAKEHSTKITNLIFPNMYGPGDHLDPIRAHALGGLVYRLLIAKFENRSEFTIWGSGKPVREWMYVEDAVDAISSALMIETDVEVINVGSGYGISILDLASMIAKEVGYEGTLIFDTSKQDGAPHKTMEATRGRELLNWLPKTSLENGIKKSVAWYASEIKQRGGLDGDNR